MVGALLSPETGIVSSHALMEDLEREIGESEKGELVFGTRVVRIDKVEGGGGKRGDGSEDGWVVQTVTNDGGGGEGERSAVLARVVINSAGLKYASPACLRDLADCLSAPQRAPHREPNPPCSRAPQTLLRKRLLLLL